MDKNVFVISIVRDTTDGSLLVICKKEEGCRHHTHVALPSAFTKTGENETQCAIRACYEATGITPKNPVEAASVMVEKSCKKNSYKTVFFISTEFSGSIHPTEGTDVVWQTEDEIQPENHRVTAYVLHQILSGKYVDGTYYHDEDEFSISEIRDL